MKKICRAWRVTPGSTSDISSVCYAFPFEREIRFLTRHYLPEAQLSHVANNNRAIYRQWATAGWLRITPGDCIDDDRIRDDILRDAEIFSIKPVGFDTWNATYLRTQLQGAGLDVKPFPQTCLKFSPVAKSLEVFVNRRVIRHNGDPVLAWAVGNVVMESDANANIKLNKKKSSDKIDLAIAALMAPGRQSMRISALMCQKPISSAWRPLPAFEDYPCHTKTSLKH